MGSENHRTIDDEIHDQSYDNFMQVARCHEYPLIYNLLPQLVQF